MQSRRFLAQIASSYEASVSWGFTASAVIFVIAGISLPQLFSDLAAILLLLSLGPVIAALSTFTMRCLNRRGFLLHRDQYTPPNYFSELTGTRSNVRKDVGGGDRGGLGCSSDADRNLGSKRRKHNAVQLAKGASTQSRTL